MPVYIIGFFTVVLVIASLFMIFVVLLQRGSDGGAGSAFGGGAAESAFGGETNRVLTRATVGTAIIFFVIGLGLYLGQIASHRPSKDKIALESVAAKAQEKVEREAAAKAKLNEEPKPGETARQAMSILAAETQKGSTTKVVQKAQMIDDETPASTKP